ncbi:MAG: hypothetical protein V4671_00840, partial [Armatimonadota bacterium]
RTDNIEIVAAGVRAGSARGIAVGAMTPLFHVPFSPEISPAWQDHTIQGETVRGYLAIAPGTPGERLRREQLRALAAVPGLAGIVFRDDVSRFAQSSPLRSGYFGYNPALRAAFLREEGIDPIDTLPQALLSWSSFGIPFGFRESTPKDLQEKSDKWNRLSGQRQLSAVVETRDALEITQPGLPVWMNTEFWMANPDLTPPLVSKDYVYTVSLKPRYLDQVSLNGPVSGDSALWRQGKHQLLRDGIGFAEMHPTFDNFVIDLGSVSIKEAGRVLSTYFMPK